MKTEERRKEVNIKTVFPFLGLVVVIVLFQILTQGQVFTSRNLKAIMNDSFFILIATVAFAFVMAVGNLDLSMGTVMGVSCTCAAVAANVSLALALPAAVISGLALGCFNGFVHVHMKLSSLIATMTTQSIFTGILVLILDGGTISAPITMLSWGSTEVKVAVMLVVTIVGAYLFNYTSYGKKCKAVGSRAEAARLSGISVGGVKCLTFIILGGVVGLLGFFSLIRTGTASSTTGSSLMMDVWCAALLGGLPLSGGASCRFRSAVVGSFTMAFLSNGMTIMGLGTHDKQLIQGIVFLAAIAVSFERRNLVVIK